jgi:PadR family transcriptional regulator, regulatory protein PadR
VKEESILDIQFKKGVLELCILSMLEKADQYGYELASILSDKVNISSGGVYPVLRRLKSEEYVDTYLEESSGGPPRKYFKLTEKGNGLRKELKDDWIMLKSNIDAFMQEGGRISE